MILLEIPCGQHKITVVAYDGEVQITSHVATCLYKSTEVHIWSKCAGKSIRVYIEDQKR